MHTARLIIIFVIVFIGSLPPPKPAPAATGGAALLPPHDQTAKDIWPLTPDQPPELTVAGKKTQPPVKTAVAPAANESVAATQTADGTAAPGNTGPTKSVSGWLPFWDMSEGMRVVNEFPNALTEVSPFWYEIAPDGSVVNSPGAENNDVLARIKTRHLSIVPTIATAEGPAISAVLNDDARRAANIEQIMTKVRNPLYDGIDIDYENLPASDRDIFSRFIQELGAKVHEAGKRLVVTVNAKTSEPGSWNGAQSHDYAALGASADFVRVMAYDQHYASGPPGPVAGIDWVEKVITFSLARIPKEKLILGVPLYGYDWSGAGRAKSVVHDDAAAKSQSSQSPIEWDAQSASPFFHYSDGPETHTVWFENSRSLEAKIALVKKYDLGGIAIWRLGREDKTFYQKVKAELAP